MESTRRQICKPGNKIGFSIVCPGTTNTPLVMRNGGQPSDLFMEPEHVAACIVSAASLPDEVSITDMTMVNVQQDIW
jgi:NADP-dependent 3-hydroxy acid dehydrogenase YdfG